MAESWWRPLAEEGRLSQGDVLADLTFGMLANPRQPLLKQTASGIGEVWKPIEWSPDKQGYCHCLARGRVTAAVVLTHSCQLDKKEKAGRVIVAPVAPADRISDQKSRELIFAGQRISMVPLPEIPGLGDGYADLRLMTTLDREIVAKLERVATMTAAATSELRRRLVAFFARDGEEGRA